MHGETPQCFPVQTQKNLKSLQKAQKENKKMENEEKSEKKTKETEKKEDTVDDDMEDVLQEFFDNIGDALTSTPIPGEKLQELQTQTIAMDEEMNNILKNISTDNTPITHTL